MLLPQAFTEDCRKMFDKMRVAHDAEGTAYANGADAMVRHNAAHPLLHDTSHDTSVWSATAIGAAVAWSYVIYISSQQCMWILLLMGNCVSLPWALQAETLEVIRKHEVRMMHMQYSNVLPLGHGKDARQEL